MDSVHCRSKPCDWGFTLVEVMIVTSIISFLALVAVPSYFRARERAVGVRTTNDLRVFGEAFRLYALEKGQYPPESHRVLPPGAGMEQYLNEARWLSTPAIGGYFNWEGPDIFPYADVAVKGSHASDRQLTLIDEAVDDGNLSTGQYRKTPNGRFTYILEE